LVDLSCGFVDASANTAKGNTQAAEGWFAIHGEFGNDLPSIGHNAAATRKHRECLGSANG
jgi:hypothetical protein